MQVYSIKRSGKSPVVCSIPHCSTKMPNSYRTDFSLSKSELQLQALRLADLFADELFGDLLDIYGGIVSKISRMVVDVERFEDDRFEVMSKAGMGVLYTKSEDGAIIRRVSKGARGRYIREIYRPYHLALEKLVENCLSIHGRCLILDCHTFPSQPRAYESDRKRNRPDICLGTNRLHTPVSLKHIMTENFEANGFSVKHDSPYSGTIVPQQFYKDRNVHSIMIEVNRRLYMNERNFMKKAGFDKLAMEISGAVEKACLVFLKR